VAVLDRRATALIGQSPELSVAVGSRLLRRTRSLSHLMAAQRFVRAEDRLLATLWHLAAMWGRVTPRGTLIPFRLTHQTLAGIIGAQRPTATLAVRALNERGLLTQDDRRRYLLIGDPPDWDRVRQPVSEVEV
jgi:CRP-like cAMP-binding protein